MLDTPLGTAVLICKSALDNSKSLSWASDDKIKLRNWPACAVNAGHFAFWLASVTICCACRAKFFLYCFDLDFNSVKKNLIGFMVILSCKNLSTLLTIRLIISVPALLDMNLLVLSMYPKKVSF